MTTTHRTTTAAAVILAIGAILAPNAQAGLFSTGADPKGAGQQEAQGFLRIYSHQESTPTATTTNQAPATVYSRPDKSIIRITTPASAQQAVVRITTPPNGFNWGDAGIGAAGGLALAMLGVGGALALSGRRTRRPATRRA